MQLSLIDFNLAIEYSRQPGLAKLCAGTAGYLAPETVYKEYLPVHGSGFDHKKLDTFALGKNFIFYGKKLKILGVVLWEMVTGDRLFRKDSKMMQNYKNFVCRVPHLKNFTPDQQEFLKKLTCKDQRERFRASEALESRIYQKLDYQQTKEEVKVNKIPSHTFRTLKSINEHHDRRVTDKKNFMRLLSACIIGEQKATEATGTKLPIICPKKIFR
jgi:serine/threonine protein kinase